MMRKFGAAALLGMLLAMGALVPPIHAAERLPIADTHLHYSHDAWDVFPTDAAIALLKEAEAGVRVVLQR